MRRSCLWGWAPWLMPTPIQVTLDVASDIARARQIRAFNNFNGHRGYQNRPIGVSAWGPNLNIYRDPRWGRNVRLVPVLGQGGGAGVVRHRPHTCGHC